jgi:hypothetical protein
MFTLTGLLVSFFIGFVIGGALVYKISNNPNIPNLTNTHLFKVKLPRGATLDDVMLVLKDK